MKTRLTALALAAALGAAAGAGGCTVDPRASIQLQTICAPTDACTFKDTCDAQYIGYPTMDLGNSPSDTLWLFLQVANQSPNNADPGTNRVNTADAHIDETDVTYEGALNGSETYGSVFTVPAGGHSVISVQLHLGGATGGAGAAANEVLANVRVKGSYDDGTRFESGPFPITVRVCSAGCGATSASLGCDPAKGACPPRSDGQLPLGCIK
jgi:hypothetical protein